MMSRSSGLSSSTFSKSCRQTFMASNNSDSCRMFARPTHSDAKAHVLSAYTILGITTHVKVRCKINRRIIPPVPLDKPKNLSGVIAEFLHQNARRKEGSYGNRHKSSASGKGAPGARMARCALRGHGDCFNCRFGIHISQGLILLVYLEQQQQ